MARGVAWLLYVIIIVPISSANRKHKDLKGAHLPPGRVIIPISREKFSLRLVTIFLKGKQLNVKGAHLSPGGGIVFPMHF